MNAYELADELDYACTIAELRIDMMKRMKLSATMLRQQADRIAELEKEVKSVTEQGENFWQQLCELKAHPVKQLSDDYQGKYIEQYWNKPSVKQLSDEEITKIHLKCWDEIEFARAIIKEIRE